MARQIKDNQQFKDKLLKLIPSEIVAAFMVIQGLCTGIIIGEIDITIYTSIAVFAILLILTPFYLIKVQKVTDKSQIVVTTSAFVIWVYSLGGLPFKEWYNPQLASIILILWTLLIPFTVKRKPEAV